MSLSPERVRLLLVAALLFMTFVPDTVLWLPRLLGYTG